MQQGLIYGLVDPCSGFLRYIGKTEKGITRPYEHLQPSRFNKGKTYKDKWIRQCVKNGYKPEVTIIEECSTSDLNELEKFYIDYFRFLGVPLTNLTSGGEGVTGFQFTEDQKAIISERTKAAMTPQVRAKLSKLKKGTLPHNSSEVIDQFGNKYPSMSKAARAIGAAHSAVSYGVKNLRPVKGIFFQLTSKPLLLTPNKKKARRYATPEEIQHLKESGCSGTKIVDGSGIVYKSISLAARTLGISRKIIARILRGKTKTRSQLAFYYAGGGLSHKV